MKNEEFDNLNSEDSEFQKKVVKFVLATYEKHKRHLPPSLFVKSGDGIFKLHPIPPHLFEQQNGEQIIADGVNTIINDYDATHACFASECCYAKVKADNADAIREAVEKGIEDVEGAQQCVVLSFESKKAEEKYFYRFLITEEQKLQIEELKEYTNKDGENNLIINLFRK
jgi:hypothetical protein